MKFKKLILLLVILALLGALALFKGTQRPPDLSKGFVEPAGIGVTFDMASVKKLDLHRGDTEKFVIVKDASGAWTLSSHFGTRVRKGAIEPLLTDLSKLKGELRGDEAKLFEDFEITDEKAVQFEIFGDGEQKLAHVYLSPQRPRGTQNFVRAAGSDKVYVTDTDLLGSLAIFSDTDKILYRTFADLRILDADASKWTAIELNPPGNKGFKLVKKEDKWSFDQDETTEIELSKVNELISSAANLYADDSLDPAAHGNAFTGTAPLLRISRTEKPETVELWLGARLEEKKTRLLRTMPDGLVYEIPESSLEALLSKKRETFVKPKSP